ncbi:hypothetical protein B0H12DRAFT_81510 [Mycena haematopus]|nr:hypothetical protein B0H12DRAFT_81510 [Mycena haematopus]
MTFQWKRHVRCRFAVCVGLVALQYDARADGNTYRGKRVLTRWKREREALDRIRTEILMRNVVLATESANVCVGRFFSCFLSVYLPSYSPYLPTHTQQLGDNVRFRRVHAIPIRFSRPLARTSGSGDGVYGCLEGKFS